MDHSVVTQT